MNSDMGLLRRITRLYTFNSPLKKGKYRLAEASLRFGGPIPETIVAETSDGRRLKVNPSDSTYKFLYFIGEYEPGISEILRRAVMPGDRCLDLGANMGWHTTLMMQLVGERGEVHGFEPVPQTFELLQGNVELNKRFENVFINNVALGEKGGVVEMVLVKGQPDGHAAVATVDLESAEKIESDIITLDSYLDEHNLNEIDFVKADIEGSELPMLRGAHKLFEQEIPPIFEIEMALATSTQFGYTPNDIISFIGSKRSFEFHVIDERNAKLKKIDGFERSDIGANVLCVPTECSVERRNRLGI